MDNNETYNNVGSAEQDKSNDNMVNGDNSESKDHIVAEASLTPKPEKLK